MPARSSYTIGVVTYHARFEEYFKPLIKNLARIFPDKEIICIINGHSDKTLQIKYLDKVTRFMREFPNVRYLTYDVGQSLSKCWNQLVILSHTEKTIILSDDVYIGDLFREQIDAHIDESDIFLINRSFAHFVISKNTIRKIGWFDERLPRIGWEDTDYKIRMIIAKEPLQNIKILGSLNLTTDTEGSDWENDPTRPRTKYTYANEDFFKTKWITKYYHPEVTNFEHTEADPSYTFSRGENADTPQFYDSEVLNYEEANSGRKYSKNLFRYFVQKIFFGFTDAIISALRKAKHFLKKIAQAKPPI